jgi:hypothetical protein
VPLTGWALLDASGGRALITDTAAVLAPDSLLLLAPDSLLAGWPGLPASALLLTPQGWPSLNNRGDTLRLRGPSGALVDEITYPEAAEGRALQRISFAEPANSAQWAASPDPGGATPGRINPELPAGGRAERASVSTTPEVLEPDRHEVTFRFRFPAPTVEVTVRLFDRIGRRVGTLARGELLPGTADWVWDGVSGLDRGGLPVGIYIWHVTAVDPAGDRTWERKGTLISAGY